METTMGLIKEFDMAVSEAIEMAGQNDDGLVRKVAEIDAIFLRARATKRRVLLDRISGPRLNELRNNPKTFARFTFASGLVNITVSPFFRAVMEILAEQEKFLTLEQLLVVAATFRRDGAYKQKQKFADLLIEKLGDADSPAAWQLRSKLSYEEYMAARQQGAFVQALQWAERAVVEAEKGRDPLDRLHAQTGIAYSWFRTGRWREGRELFLRIIGEAKALPMSANHDPDRVQRLLMNCYLHSIEIAIAHDCDPDDVVRWLHELDSNPVFQEVKDQDWAKDARNAAERYVQRGT